MKKMYSIDFTKPILRNNLEDVEDNLKSALDIDDLLVNLYVPKRGAYNKIKAIGASDKGAHTYNVLYEYENKRGLKTITEEEVEIKNFYQL
jgi:hypothetical protein